MQLPLAQSGLQRGQAAFGEPPLDTHSDWTIYPRKMSARRARFEAKRARAYRVRLPSGHPYALLPTWVPYPVAKLVGMIAGATRR